MIIKIRGKLQCFGVLEVTTDVKVENFRVVCKVFKFSVAAKQNHLQPNMIEVLGMKKVNS